MKKQPVAGTLIWLTILFMLTTLVIMAIFLTSVPPEGRNTGFYVWMMAVCTAALVCFLWTANTVLAARCGRRASGAALLTIHGMIAVWFCITLVLAFVGAQWSAATGQYTDKLAILYAAMTLLMLMGASALYARDMAVQREDAAAQPQRKELQLEVVDVEEICSNLRAWAADNGEHVTAVDRLVKMIEGIRTSLDFAAPGKVGTLEEGAGQDVHDLNVKIIATLEELGSRVAELQQGSSDPGERIEGMTEVVRRIESMLKKRQQHLLIGERAS